MRPSFLFVVLALLCWAVPSSTLQGKTTRSSKAKTRHVTSTKTRTKTTVKSKGRTGKRTARSKSKSRSSARSGPPRQQAPTPGRYAEIQQALADKGYYKGAVTGEWGPDSVAALKQFQQDQNMAVDGKIGAKTLIALGLGPKRDSTNGAVAKPNM